MRKSKQRNEILESPKNVFRTDLKSLRHLHAFFAKSDVTWNWVTSLLLARRRFEISTQQKCGRSEDPKTI